MVPDSDRGQPPREPRDRQQCERQESCDQQARADQQPAGDRQAPGNERALGERPAGGFAHLSLRMARRIAVGVIGATVVLFGLVMLLTPGPAIIVIPVGLSILALEFAWARRLLARFHEQASRARDSWFRRKR